VTTATIDDLDRRIIHALYIDGLLEAGIVRVVGLLNTQRIGQSDWVVRIRCTPDAASTVAQALARRPDTSWVQLTSGGTEIFSTIRAHDERQRTALLLEQLPSSRRIVSLEAHSVLHLFIDSSASTPSMAAVLTAAEVEQFRPPPPERNGRSDGVLRDEDWELIKILAADGRATYRQLALQTHWHESTVRRRMDELVASGVLYFDMDVSHAVPPHGGR
jgi:DNA-binding Lrp family transcriptional regulator